MWDAVIRMAAVLVVLAAIVTLLEIGGGAPAGPIESKAGLGP